MKPVIVLGPHRSGTSVTTRVVSLLGLSLCAEEDRMVKWDNPTGHWESRSLMELNDELLGRLQGFWWAPPELADGWESSAALEPFRQRASDRFYSVHPPQDWVWKDPRLCLTLPFWTSALDVEPICILTLRHPSEIAESLIARDGFGPRHALAIWEWYVATALRHLRGRPVAVVRYRELLADPLQTVSWLRDDLGDLGAAVSTGDVAAAAAFVDQRLCHHRARRSRCRPAEAQKDLQRRLMQLDSCYGAFPDLEIPPFTPATAELMAVHRRLQQLQVEYDERTQWALRLDKDLGERDLTVRELQATVERLEAELATKEEAG